MSHYPTDIRAAIDWLAEAQAAHLAAQRELNRTRAELELEYREANKEKDRYSLFRDESQSHSYLSVPELIEAVDLAHVEVKRREGWLLHLQFVANGKAFAGKVE